MVGELKYPLKINANKKLANTQKRIASIVQKAKLALQKSEQFAI